MSKFLSWCLIYYVVNFIKIPIIYSTICNSIINAPKIMIEHIKMYLNNNKLTTIKLINLLNKNKYCKLKFKFYSNFEHI